MRQRPEKVICNQGAARSRRSRGRQLVVRELRRERQKRRTVLGAIHFGKRRTSLFQNGLSTHLLVIDLEAGEGGRRKGGGRQP